MDSIYRLKLKLLIKSFKEIQANSLRRISKGKTNLDRAYSSGEYDMIGFIIEILEDEFDI